MAGFNLITEVDVEEVCISGLLHLGDPLLVVPPAISSAHAGILPEILWRTKSEDWSKIPGMGGERASGTRQRLAGQICYECKSPLPAPHRPGEQLCARCDAAKTPKRRVTIRTKEHSVFAKERNDYKSGLTSPLTCDRNVEKLCRLTEAFTDQDLRGRLIDPIQLYSSKISNLMDMLAQVRPIAV